MRIFGSLLILTLMLMDLCAADLETRITSLMVAMEQKIVREGLGTMDIGHAKNVLRAKNLILRESGIHEDDLPVIRPERMRRVQAAFNDSDDGYAFYNEEEAFEVINFIGHNTENTSEIFFQISDKMRTSRIEGASIALYLRTAIDPKEQKAIFEISDHRDNLLNAFTVTTPNSPFKLYRIPVDGDALQRTLRAAGPDNFFSLKLAARAMGDPSDDLLMVKGRLGHMPHMGIVLAIKFPSTKLLARRRSRRSLEDVMRGQCDEGQTSCCPHVQVFSWEELGFPHIVAPTKFHSVICRGTCKDYAYSDYKHTESRKIVTEHIKTACCHPAVYEPQKVIWMGMDEEIIQREIPNFYATRCVCD